MTYFKKEEMIRCYHDRKEDRCKDCRLTQAVLRMPNGIDENIKALVADVMDPARRKLGKPVFINSGFRCPRHNASVGGVSNSQHIRGEACDCRCEDNRRLVRIIVEQGRYDQLIIYPSFVHVSWKKNGANRRQILKKTASGYSAVSAKEVLQG